MSVGEMNDLLSWIGDPPRHPRQTHGLNESDSEVVDLGNGTWLAATTDTVSEEIDVGLYRDPYRIGWVTAMASLSDLAAVGAAPTGMLLSAEWAASFGTQKKAEVARGFSDALRRCGTYWLGGDSGRGRSTVLGGVALGICHSKPLSRLGMRPGDVLCLTGALGNGPALAMRLLLGQAPEAFSEEHYLPVARLDAGLALRELASAAMDTSDGLLSTLHTLSVLNRVGLQLQWDENLLSAEARRYCREQSIPEWTLWMVEHGDYQLVLSIPRAKLEEARERVPDLQVLGEVSESPGIRLKLPDGRNEPWDPELGQGLLTASKHDLSAALRGLIRHAMDQKMP